MADEEIMVCPRCGSKKISGLKFDSAWKKEHLPISGIYQCLECSYQGLPLLLDSENDYKKLREVLRQEEKE